MYQIKQITVARLFSIGVLIDILRRLPSWEAFYSAQSVLNPIASSSINPYQLAPTFTLVVHGLLALSLIITTKFQKTIFVFILLLNLALNSRCHFADLAGNQIFNLCFAFYITSLYKHELGRLLYLIQLSFIYFFSFLNKLFEPLWSLNPEALRLGLNNPAYATDLGLWLGQQDLVVTFFHYLVMFIQLNSSIMIFLVAMKHRLSQILVRCILVQLLLFHLFSIFLLKLSSFPYLCLIVVCVAVFYFQDDGNELKISKKSIAIISVLFVLLNISVQLRINLPYPLTQNWAMMAHPEALRPITISFQNENGASEILLPNKKHDSPEWKSFLMRAAKSGHNLLRLQKYLCKNGNKTIKIQIETANGLRTMNKECQI